MQDVATLFWRNCDVVIAFCPRLEGTKTQSSKFECIHTVFTDQM